MTDGNRDIEHQYKGEYKPLVLDELKDEPYVLIKCPKCSDSTPAKNIDLSSKVAKCDGCNAVFSVAKDVLDLQQQTVQEEITKPVGVDILAYDNELELTVSQPPAILYIFISTLLWLPALIFILFYIKNGHNWALYPGLALLFAFVYSVLKLIKSQNERIYITVDGQKLSVEYRPHNFVSDKSYNVDTIEQIFVDRDVNGLNLSMIINEEEGQKSEKIISRIKDITKAKYLEQEIEKFLGFKNKKVSGEEH